MEVRIHVAEGYGLTAYEKGFPMSVTFYCETMDEFDMVTTASEYPRLQEILNYGGEHSNYKKSPAYANGKSYAQWIGQIQKKHDRVLECVNQILSACRRDIFGNQIKGVVQDIQL